MYKRQQLGGAALDVLVKEPPEKNNPLIELAKTMPNLIITPHIAWASDSAVSYTHLYHPAACQLGHRVCPPNTEGGAWTGGLIGALVGILGGPIGMLLGLSLIHIYALLKHTEGTNCGHRNNCPHRNESPSHRKIAVIIDEF